MGMYTNDTDERLYLNEDKSKVVPEGHPDARFLLVAAGGEIPEEEAARYGLMGKKAQREAEKADEAETAKPATAEAKAVQPAEDKAAKAPEKK